MNGFGIKGRNYVRHKNKDLNKKEKDEEEEKGRDSMESGVGTSRREGLNM